MQRLILDWLNTLPGLWAWRQNTGAFTVPAEGEQKRRHIAFGVPGQGDITGLARGVRLEIEVKRRGRGATDLQAGFQAKIAEYGGIAFTCDSLEVACSKLREAYVRRGWVWSSAWEV